MFNEGDVDGGWGEEGAREDCDELRNWGHCSSSLYFAEELRISSISFRKCNTRSSASRSTAFSQSGGGERCARASGLSRAWRIEATETFNAFAKSSWSTRENRRSVAFLKVMYAVPLTTIRLYIILHTPSSTRAYGE